MFGLGKQNRGVPVEEQISTAVNEALSRERERVAKSMAFTKELALSLLMEAGAVIAISNEHDNPIVGFIEKIDHLGQSNDPVPVIKDYVSGKTLLVPGQIYQFTEQRLKGLMKLTPEERVAIVYMNCYGGEEVHFRNLTTPAESILTYTEILEKLMTSGFYKDLSAHKTKNTPGTDTLSA